MLVVALLALVCALASSSAPAVDTARFEDVVAQSSASKNNVIKLTSTGKYKSLVLKPGRDWESIVLLSASSKVGCVRCAEWEEVLGTAAMAYKSTLKAGQKPKVIFYMIRFDDANEVYQTYQLNHAPTLIWVGSAFVLSWGGGRNNVH